MPSWVKDPIEFWQAADTLNEPMPKSTWSMKLPSPMNSRQNSVKRS
jgi:hypothetical protein